MELLQEDLDLGLDLIIQDSLDLRIVGHLMQTLAVMVVGTHLVSVVDHTLLNRDSFLQPLKVLMDLLLEYYLAVTTLQVNKRPSGQNIGGSGSGSVGSANNHQGTSGGSAGSFGLSGQSEGGFGNSFDRGESGTRDLFKIVSKEEWEE